MMLAPVSAVGDQLTMLGSFKPMEFKVPVEWLFDLGIKLNCTHALLKWDEHNLEIVDIHPAVMLARGTLLRLTIHDGRTK